MKLCAIYNVWDDWNFLKYSIKNIEPLVEGIIVVGSDRSNHGEFSPIPIWVNDLPMFFYRNPQHPQAIHCETDKRNYGLQKAKQLGFTHFLTIDADELYEPSKFKKAKERFLIDPFLKGIVCPTQVYFKSPKLTIGFDGTRVPFIHKLSPTIRHDFNKMYPFAWEDGKIRIDPTRSLTINSGVEYTDDVICHHYSWCRGDYEKKIRNSTARRNLEQSCILTDLREGKEGYFCEYYRKTLVRASVDFSIPEYEFNTDSQARVR